MSEYFKGLVATLATVVMAALVFLDQVQGWIPVIVAGLNALLVILVPNTRNGQNVRDL